MEGFGNFSSPSRTFQIINKSRTRMMREVIVSMRVMVYGGDGEDGSDCEDGCDDEDGDDGEYGGD